MQPETLQNVNTGLVIILGVILMASGWVVLGILCLLMASIKISFMSETNK